MEKWRPYSWRKFFAYQQPEYDDKVLLNDMEKKLKKQPSLVFADEIDELKKKLGEVVEQNGFLLQGGDCAESFDGLCEQNIRDTFKVIMQMAVILTFGAGQKVVKIARMAGQFAKPRSADTETQNQLTLPVYRGDIINGSEFTASARKPDPRRLMQAYYQSASTLNLLRAFSHGGLASLEKVHAWNLDFVKGPESEQFKQIAVRIDEAIQFIIACGITGDYNLNLRSTSLYTSHEALLLPYEEALIRSTKQKWYSGSAHMLWVGDRTRQPDGAHVEFLRGIQNPIGIKVGPSMTVDDLNLLLDKLNPHNEAGRITLITRMGANYIEKGLPPLISSVQQEGRKVIWSCDPMHGNTTITASGHKTREVNQILKEVKSFFIIHKANNTYAGGIHFEMTGSNVTECIGGKRFAVTEKTLSNRYTTQCDPRLNAGQALELAFMIAEMFKQI